MKTLFNKELLYKIVRTYNLILAILPSIAFYRATVQPEYRWGLLAIEGKGMSSDYWILLAFMVLAWTTFALEIWFKRSWYYIFPITLFALVSAVLVYGNVYEEMVFQGDVWNFKFELGFLFVALSTLILLLAIIWAFKDLKGFKKSTFSSSGIDKMKLLGGLSLSIFIFLLFAQGNGGVHTITDGIAVGLTVVQALFMATIIDRTGSTQQE